MVGVQMCVQCAGHRVVRGIIIEEPHHHVGKRAPLPAKPLVGIYNNPPTTRRDDVGSPGTNLQFISQLLRPSLGHDQHLTAI